MRRNTPFAGLFLRNIKEFWGDRFESGDGSSGHGSMYTARQANNAKKHPRGRHKINRGVEKNPAMWYAVKQNLI
jgi:hypothetical protein